MEMTYTEILVTTHCWCGIALAIPSNLMRYAKDDHNHGVYCPLGHQFYFNDSNLKKLREAEARLAEERRRSRANRDLLHAEERSHSATRGHLTRTKKRASAGVCPCCNRTFQQLARHMKAKHPDYSEAA